MLNLAAATIFLGLEPTDMRKSFDTLAARVRDNLGGDPLSGSWYVFRNKAGDRLKILYWDGDGFALWQKRLAKGAFEFPKVIGAAAGVSITATDLALIGRPFGIRSASPHLSREQQRAWEQPVGRPGLDKATPAVGA